MIPHADIIEMTTWARLKAGMDFKTDNDQQFFEDTIKGLSQQFAQFLDRFPLFAERTEYYKYREVYRLQGFPIEVVADVPTVEIYLGDTLLVLDEDYVVFSEERWRGKIEMLVCSDSLLRSIKITYKGGMAVDTAAFVVAYPDIEQALWLQAMLHYKQKDKLDVASISVGTHSVSFTKFRPLKFLPEVEQVLENYRR